MGGFARAQAAYDNAEPPEAEEHLLDVYYSDLGRVCTIECSCGCIARGQSWEEAGAGMDDHMEGLG